MNDDSNDYGRENLEDLAALDALDLLDEAQREEYERLLDQADEETRIELAQYRDVVLAMGLSTRPVEPPPKIKNRLMRQIMGREWVLIPSDEGWLNHAVPGVRYKTLNVAADRATVLTVMERGAVFPLHQHAEDEECYVITGSLASENLTIGEGDFLLATEGTSHGPLSAPDGCVLLLVLSSEDYAAFTAHEE